MKINRITVRTAVIVMACLFVLPLFAVETQALMLEMNREELTLGADSIIVGTVTGVSSRWNSDKTCIYTEVVISVEENLKGPGNRPEVTVIVPGGTVGDINQWVEDVPAFTEGEKVGIFLKELHAAALDQMSLGGMRKLALPGMMTVHGQYQGKVTLSADEPGPIGGISPAGFKRNIHLELAGLSLPGSSKRNISLLPSAQPATDPSVFIEEIIHNQNILGITPDAASAGTDTQVTVIGSGFGTRGGNDHLMFYYTTHDEHWLMPSAIDSWTDTEIKARVPAGQMSNPYTYFFAAASGPVAVYKNGNFSNFIPRTTTFGFMGKKWPGTGPTVSYRVNPGGVQTRLDAVEAAAESWNNAGANFSFAYDGATSATDIGYNEINEVIWKTLPQGVLGQASIWSNQNNNILECDFAFNTQYTWNTGVTCPVGQFDVQSVGAHEFGHWLGLTDLYGNYPGFPQDTGKVMYGRSSSGATRRNISPGDTQGIQWIYGTAQADTGILSITIEPAAARSDHARWSADGGTTWFDSGEQELVMGAYTIKFEEIPGWDVPTEIVVHLTGGGIVEETGIYTPWFGDINCSGWINVDDAILILRHMTGLVNLEDDYGAGAAARAKVSGGEGPANVADANLILQHIVNLIEQFPLNPIP